MGGPGTGGEHARPDLRSFGSEPSSGTPGALFLLILAHIYHKDLYKNKMLKLELKFLSFSWHIDYSNNLTYLPFGLI